MPDSPAPKSVHLLKPWTLVLAALVVGGLLLLTYNGEDVFRPDGQQPDAVSANYAELLLKAHPEDASLRQELIRLLIDLGDYARADQYLQDWEKPDALLAGYYQLEIDALSARQDGDDERLRLVREQMLAFDRQYLPLNMLKRLSVHALALELPQLAADVYLQIAELEQEQREQHLQQAARWYLASNQPAKAADIFQELMRTTQVTEQRPLYVQQAYAALVAAGLGDQASQLAVDELDSMQFETLDPQWLEQSVQVAMGSYRFDLGQRIVDQWLALQPESAQALQAAFNLHLAFGDIKGAWIHGQQLLELRPEAPDLLKQMAQLGEWNGYHQEALGYWVRYLGVRTDRDAQEHAWRLSLQLFDFERGIPLLVSYTAQRQLSDVELDALIYAHESLGTPDEAEAWLRVYLRQHAGHRKAWLSLLQNLGNTEQYAQQALVWAVFARHFPLTVNERIDWAQVHWRLFDPQRAWDVLNIDTRDIDSAEYWRMRAGLAWDLERDDELRFAYENMRARDIELTFGEESQLINLYLVEDPRQSLDLLVESWQRTGDPQRLFMALQLAEQLDDWPLFKQLVAEGEASPKSKGREQLLLAQGTLASREGRNADAERLYRQGLARFPEQVVFRERLLWLLVDQGRNAELALLTEQWQPQARNESVLWLPFAAATQRLGRHQQALAWYRLYLGANQPDFLVQAAYADALEQAGYFDQALRLRHRLLSEWPAKGVSEEPRRYTTWLRLFASTYSPQRAEQIALSWRDGSPAMLQLWFERLLAQFDALNQETQKDAWLAWARTHGLQIDRYEQVQEALRTYNRAAMQRLLEAGALDPAQHVEVLARQGHTGAALGQALSRLGDDEPAAVREQLWRQALELHERYPQGMRLGWSRQDFGGLDLVGPQWTLARHLGEDWYANLDLQQVRYKADELDNQQLGKEHDVLLELQRRRHDGAQRLIVDSSLRDDQSRHGFGLARSWQLDSRNELEVALDWHRESLDSGLMRALGRQDALRLSGNHAFSGRDRLAWTLAERRFATRYGDDLGSGQAMSLELSHALQFEGPSWTLRTGVDYQRNLLRDTDLSSLLSSQGGPVLQDELSTTDLLDDHYGQIYVGSNWRRGFPGALNRNRSQYTWLFDMLAGWQWQESTFNYGISAGVGMVVLGDDELAINLGYQSAPQGGEGEPGGTLGVTYSLRFGR